MQAILSILLAALASLARKLFITAMVEKLLASIMFIALHYFAKKSTNLIDDQLVQDAYFAYYGKPYPEPLKAEASEPESVPSTVVLPNQNKERSEANTIKDDRTEYEDLLPKQLIDQ